VQVQELLSDLQQAFAANQEHFLGAVVTTRSGEAAGEPYWVSFTGSAGTAAGAAAGAAAGTAAWAAACTAAHRVSAVHTTTASPTTSRRAAAGTAACTAAHPIPTAAHIHPLCRGAPPPRGGGRGGRRVQHGPPPHQLTCHCPASASCCCPTAVAHSGVVWCVQVWGRSRHQHDTRGDEQHAGPALLSETMPGIDATATHTLMKTCTGSQQAAAAAAEARGVRRAWQRHSAAAGSQVNHSSRLASL
jgi:hypothetical protein